MIIFDIECMNSHRFEGWFNNSEEYEKQVAEKLVTCPFCGTDQVAKVPTASRINLNKQTGMESVKNPHHYIAPEDINTFVKQLHDHVIRNFDDVGENFAHEAKRIHYGEAEERNIRGIATYNEVKELREEGINAIPLPQPKDKNKLN